MMLLKKKKPTGKAGGSSYAPVRLCYQHLDLARAFLLPATRKRATRVGETQLLSQLVLF